MSRIKIVDQIKKTKRQDKLIIIKEISHGLSAMRGENLRWLSKNNGW